MIPTEMFAICHRRDPDRRSGVDLVQHDLVGMVRRFKQDEGPDIWLRWTRRMLT